jgi:hypothetical protein
MGLYPDTGPSASRPSRRPEVDRVTAIPDPRRAQATRQRPRASRIDGYAPSKAGGPGDDDLVGTFWNDTLLGRPVSVHPPHLRAHLAVDAERVRRGARRRVRSRRWQLNGSNAVPSTRTRGRSIDRRRPACVREGGLEPPRPLGHRILSPARLPHSATLASAPTVRQIRGRSSRHEGASEGTRRGRHTMAR